MHKGLWLLAAVALFGCSTNSATEKVGGQPSRIQPPPPNELVPVGSPDQRSEVSLPPLVESGSRLPLWVRYDEFSASGQQNPAGNGLASSLIYDLTDGQEVSLLYLDTGLGPEYEHQAFSGASPIALRVEGIQRWVTAGRMTTSYEGGGVFRITFEELEVAGTSMGKLNGYMVGEIEERCYYLAPLRGGSAAAYLQRSKFRSARAHA
jgi:hypothetical protein